MPNRPYHRVMAAFMDKPWAILPSKLAQIAEILVLRVEGNGLSDEEIAERIEAESYSGKRRKPMPGYGGGVAVIPVYGVITPRADVMQEISGGTSMQGFMAALTQAANDPAVESILLDVDSPGGQVDQVPEAAALIRSVRSSKPVTAVANTMAASAAYWLASQASELVVTPSGEVGSVGVFAAHNDVSEAMAAQGVKTTLISAGKYKTELNPYAPLTDEARAGVQSTINEFYDMFTKDVAAGRRVTAPAVRRGFGEGRMVTARSAVREGMADRVGTYDQTLGKMISQLSSGGRRAEGFMTADEVRAGENLLMLPAGTSSNTTSNSSKTQIYITEMWPSEEDKVEVSAVEDEPLYDSDSGDGLEEPQMTLAELRQNSRQTAIGEREKYLALIRRMTK